MQKVLIPLPSKDFDPSEAAIPWKTLNSNKFEVIFATTNGTMAECDQRMLHGTGLGPLAPLLAADKNAKLAYREMSQSNSFENPIKWSEINSKNFDGIILPGGHAKGMREYLESEILQDCISDFFVSKKPVGAICHGVVLAARSKRSDGKSVLWGRKTTALLVSQEMSAWLLTCIWLGNYYRTYPQTVQAEVTSVLKDKKDLLSGPLPLLRDSPEILTRGFVVRDGNYLSARWPGDAHLFANKFLEMLSATSSELPPKALHSPIKS